MTEQNADFISDDAWKQHHDLLERFTVEGRVRNDLRVTALACKRSVRLAVGTGRPHPALPGIEEMTYTTRNVGTMRELAQALLDACDFVDQSNPEWARSVLGPIVWADSNDGSSR